jgi:membrane protein implicated in regulation of membrane protease activity
MSRKAYFIFSISTGLLKGTILMAIVLWLLPLWEIHIPLWGLILIIIAFLIYEIVTFRLGRRALERKPAIWSNAMIGCCGTATTPLTPSGYVRVNGELWHASSSDTHINEGDDIIVVGMDRLNLHVAPLHTSRE